MRLSTVGAALIFAVTFLVSSLAQSGAPELGTWIVDVAKSKYSPGPGPQSQTVKYEAVSNGVKRTIDTVTAKGEKIHTEVISGDGRTATVTQTGADTQGQKVNNTIVQTRQ